MLTNENRGSLRLNALRLAYLLSLFLSLYLLHLSSADEIYTIWGVIHPTFLPMFIITTLLLLVIIFSTEKVEHKLAFTILHSIFIHSFFIIMFPAAGNVGVQQMMLGKTHLVFDNVISHGFGWGSASPLSRLYILLRGENLQTAFSVIFARMFGVDVYWSHILLVPFLWGIFVPVVAFVFSRMLGAKKNISVLSSLLVSLFPANIIWGAVSIPNGLSYLFFFCFVYFLLKYVNKNGKGNLFIVTAFFFATFLSHYLAGTIAFSLLLLANSVKTYQTEKKRSSASAKFMLLLAFIFSVSILPFALAYRRFFYSTANTYFSLQPLFERPFAETVLALLFGRYFDLISRLALITSLIFGIAAVVGLAAVVYLLGVGLKNSPKKSINPPLLFLTLALSMIIIDDRITRYFMINVPFVEIDRLWVFRDFILVPFVALFVGAVIQGIHPSIDVLSAKIVAFSRKIPTHRFSRATTFFTRIPLHETKRLASTLLHIGLLLMVSGWITASVYYAYPHWAPLQTTSYELEAVKYIEATTDEPYIVISDSWITFAGAMIAGTQNPQAYYFSSGDPHGITLLIEMRHNSTNETMKEAMKTNNATTAYFIIEKPRLGTHEYDRIKSQAIQNGVKTYPGGVFYYKDEEKLRIFYFRRES